MTAKSNDTGMSRKELALWLGFLVFWGLMCLLTWWVATDKNAVWYLAVLILPIILAMVAPAMVIYGLLAFLINALLLRQRRKIRLIVSAIVLAIVGIGLPAAVNLIDTARLGTFTLGDLDGKTGHAPRVVALIFPADPLDEAGDPALCHSYCQRLLYNGEAEVVLTGVVPAGTPGDIRPEAVPLRAWSRRMGESCRAEGLGIGNGMEVRDRMLIPQNVASRSLAGECLSSRPAQLAEADLVIFERLIVDGANSGQAERRVRRVETFETTGGRTTLIFRKTAAQYRAVVVPMWPIPEEGGFLTMARGGHTGRGLDRPSYLRQVTGLAMAPPRGLGIEALRRIAIADLDKGHITPPGTASADRGPVAEYLAALTPETIADVDMPLLRRIIRTTGLPWQAGSELSQAVRRLGDTAAPLAPDLLEQLSSTKVTDERMGYISRAFFELPKAVHGRYASQVMAIARDPERREAAFLAISRAGYGPPETVLPDLVAMLKSESWPSRRLAENALCLMGEGARSGQQALLDHALQTRTSYPAKVALYRLGLFDTYKTRRKDRFVPDDNEDLGRLQRRIEYDLKRNGDKACDEFS